MEVAKTILQQLGGNRFRAMTGAKHFATSGNDLSFKLPSNFAAQGINHVRVILDPSDTYTIKFSKIRGVNVKEIAEDSGVYCDMLQTIFTQRTGLDTRL